MIVDPNNINIISLRQNSLWWGQQSICSIVIYWEIWLGVPGVSFSLIFNWRWKRVCSINWVYFCYQSLSRHSSIIPSCWWVISESSSVLFAAAGWWSESESGSKICIWNVRTSTLDMEICRWYEDSQVTWCYMQTYFVFRSISLSLFGDVSLFKPKCFRLLSQSMILPSGYCQCS